MTVLFQLSTNTVACRLRVTDAAGQREFLLSAGDSPSSPRCFRVELWGDTVQLTPFPTLCPPPPTGHGAKAWLKRQGRRAENALTQSAFFLVACTYTLSQPQEGEIILLQEKWYSFASWETEFIGDLVPVEYLFFEALRHGERLAPVAATCTNRRAALKLARLMALLTCSEWVDGCGLFFVSILFHPLQMGRVRFLTGKRKIFRVLSRFHCMSDTERERILRRNDV